MKIVKLKYLIASLVIHSALVSFLLLSENSSKKAETSIIVAKIIKIEETSKFDSPKKKNNSKTKIIEKTHTIIKKPVEEKNPNKDVLKTEGLPKKFQSSKLDTMKIDDDVNRAILGNRKMEAVDSLIKKSSENVNNEDKNLSKAIYKIGSINNPHPPYPIIARKKGLEGKLILKVSVNNDGSVKSVSVGKSSGHKILDKVSKETIKKWTFIPAKKMGQAVEDKLTVPIRFVLTK